MQTKREASVAKRVEAFDPAGTPIMAIDAPGTGAVDDRRSRPSRGPSRNLCHSSG